MDDHNTSLTMTTAQIDSQLKADAVRLDRAEQRLAEIRKDASDIERGPDSDAIKAARLADIEPVQSQREDDAGAAVETALANIEQILTQTGSSVLTLTPDEHAVANTRRADIRDAVNSDPLGDLVTQVRHALVTDDRPALYNFAKFLPRRLSDTGTADTTDDGQVAWSKGGSQQDREDLRRMLAEIRDRVSDQSLRPLHDKAVELRSRALKLDREARKRQRAQETYGFQSKHEVRW